jgi:glyoxylase-like metal-dependent hydrolase (beta-lactamase superfamily II)
MSRISFWDGSIGPRVQTLRGARATFELARSVEYCGRNGYIFTAVATTNMAADSQRIALEDELGDVLEKAMNCAGLTPEALAERSGVAVSRILDAIDYRPELGAAECSRLAAALGLNEVGLCALASGKYPLPGADGLPFQLWPLRMAHGIGVVNAYVVQSGPAGPGLLFDTGPGAGALEGVWPRQVAVIDAIFVTHIEAEHAGGLPWAAERFRVGGARIPAGACVAHGLPMGEGETVALGDLAVTAFRTPGHCAMHNCYHVRSTQVASARSLLVSGDLVFAGSAGGPYYCKRQLREHLRRVLTAVPEDTVVAPGHGPMTTAGNELRFNPFVS